MNFSFLVFIFISNGEGRGPGGAGGVVWKGFVRGSDVAIRGNSGGLCASYTARSDPSNTHRQQGICEHGADMVLPLTDAYTYV